MERQPQEPALGAAGTQVQDLLIQILQGQQKQMDKLLWTRAQEQAAHRTLFGRQQALNEKLEVWQGIRAGVVEGLRVPKMDRGDNPEPYLESFERRALAMGWAHKHWAYQLGRLLTGRADCL